MKQVHFRGKIHVICKGAKRVDGGMDDDAGEQTPATIKNRDKQKAHRDGKNDLAQIAHKIHAATVACRCSAVTYLSVKTGKTDWGRMQCPLPGQL